MVSAWQRRLEPDPRVRAAVEMGLASDEHAAWLRVRFGWAGGGVRKDGFAVVPRTLAEMASLWDTRAHRAALLDRAAVRAAVAAARAAEVSIVR